MSKDTIYRQDAIDIIEDFPHGDVWNVESMEEMVYRIKQLPSAPERKTGKWLGSENRDEFMECSNCHYEEEWYSIGGYYQADTFKFCPNCGADMREGQDAIN